MDIQPQSQQSISDDQELAKVLAGITQQANGPADASAPLETPVIPMPTLEEPPVADEPVATEPEPVVTPVVVSVTDDLSAIKSEALNELRPLVDKLNVEPDEKFDTYLLLLRSTDDRSLIAPAYESAHAIADEARRAQALLDIIKEIDYLSGGQQQ